MLSGLELESPIKKWLGVELISCLGKGNSPASNQGLKTGSRHHFKKLYYKDPSSSVAENDA